MSNGGPLEALLVYPATLEHYGVLLIAPIMWLWVQRDRSIGGIPGSIAVITALYALGRFQLALASHALAWVWVAAHGLRLHRQQRAPGVSLPAGGT